MKKINWANVKSVGGKVIKKTLIVAGSVLGAAVLTKMVLGRKVIEKSDEVLISDVDNSENQIEE